MAKVKKKIKKDFVLFYHEDFEIKKKLIDVARQLRQKKAIAEQLSSALIYASFAEYVGEHVLENCRHLAYNATMQFYGGIIGFDERGRDQNKPLGHIICQLEKYDFPLKREIVDLLGEIADSRNNLFHNLAKAKQEDLA